MVACMAAATKLMENLARLDPKVAAKKLAAADEIEPEWLDVFTESLDHQRSGRSLENTLAVWGLSQSEASRLFGVSRQALSKWLRQGVPAERSSAVADLAAATDILVHYLKRDRIPGVVRRAIASEGGKSLLDLVRSGDTADVPRICREMFDFAKAQSR